MLSVSFARPHLGTVDKGSKQNRGGNSIRKMIVLLIPYWRINCKMVPLTVLKCNILNYSKNCCAKNMCGWTYGYYVGLIWRRKTCLAAGQRAEVEYTYSENIDAIAWLTYCFFFSIPARLFFFFSLLFTRAILRSSERLKQASTSSNHVKAHARDATIIVRFANTRSSGTQVLYKYETFRFFLPACNLRDCFFKSAFALTQFHSNSGSQRDAHECIN